MLQHNQPWFETRRFAALLTTRAVQVYLILRSAQRAPRRMAASALPSLPLDSAVLGRADRALVFAELLDGFLRERQVDQVLVFRHLALRDVANALHQRCGS